MKLQVYQRIFNQQAQIVRSNPITEEELIEVISTDTLLPDAIDEELSILVHLNTYIEFNLSL